ncbi:peptidoglycan-recognition protein SC2-like [Pseudophryne corroboree]|uniref:peptidoglycan-recognition protein SC2-like n=1 Tax=Pseudophryne corroboree TaxID=495146 RepID=UPI0030821D31
MSSSYERRTCPHSEENGGVANSRGISHEVTSPCCNAMSSNSAMVPLWPENMLGADWLALWSEMCQSSSTGCPTILTKSQWGGRAATCRTAMATPVTYVIIHHTAGASCSSQSTCITQTKNVQSYHMDSNAWCDIGYSFLVGGDGSIFEGRGWTSVGAHAPNYNSNSIGINLIGTFTSSNPTTAAQNAAKNLIACGVTRGYIKSAYILKGHRNVTATECPGNTFYNTVKTWPRFQA